MKGGGILLIVFASKFAWVCILCIGVGGPLYLFVSSVLVAWRHGYQAEYFRGTSVCRDIGRRTSCQTKEAMF